MDALRSPLKNRAGQVITGAVILAFVALVARLVYINAHHGASLMARAERQQRSGEPVRARRGFVVDSRGRILAGTILRRSVFADPKVLPDKSAAAEIVSSILGGDPGEISQDLVAAEDRRFFVIRRGITEQQA